MISILIIEDDENKSKDISMFFSNHGISGGAITAVDNVTDGLNFLRSIKYDVVILDLNLPLRKNDKAVENGGQKVLYALTSRQYITPTYVIGLTQYEEYQSSNNSYFRIFDLNIYNYYNDEWRNVLTHKIDWMLKTSSELYQRKINQKIIVCTHGVMTMGSWPQKIKEIFSPLGYKVVTYKYLHYSALKIITPWSRKEIFKDYRIFIQRVFEDHPDCEFNFISHSFGTFMLMSALKKINIQYRPKINKIILSGNVLKSSFNNNEIIDKFEPKLIINDCAFNDYALLICNFTCMGLGNAGRVGFNGYNERILNRFIKGGHSDFFDDELIRKNWVPTIVSDENKLIDERNFTLIRENFESIINMFSPLLIPIIIAVVLVIFLFVPPFMN